MNAFESDIEHMVQEGKYTYIEALVEYGVQKRIDDIALQHMIKSSRPLLAKLDAESRRLRLLKDGRGKRTSPSTIDKGLK